MPVFDFTGSPEGVREPECTYELFYSSGETASPEHPILILDNKGGALEHHTEGAFEDPGRRTTFSWKRGRESVSADILQIDARFVSLLKWLGENRISVRLSGENRAEGYAVYRIRETALGGGGKLSAADGFLQFMIERLLASEAPSREMPD